MKTYVFIIFLLLMFIQHFQRPIKEDLWIAVARKIVALTFKNQPYQGINKNPDLYQGVYSAFNLLCIDIDASATQNNFLE